MADGTYSEDMLTLRRALAKCGPNATAILLRQAQRLTAGAETYGDDFDDGRNWILELINEVSDAQNYISRAAILGPFPPRLRVVEAMLGDIHRLLQAEYAEQQKPEAAE